MIWWLDVTIINKTSCDTNKSNDMYSKLHITYVPGKRKFKQWWFNKTINYLSTRIMEHNKNTTTYCVWHWKSSSWFGTDANCIYIFTLIRQTINILHHILISCLFWIDTFGGPTIAIFYLFWHDYYNIVQYNLLNAHLF